MRDTRRTVLARDANCGLQDANLNCEMRQGESGDALLMHFPIVTVRHLMYRPVARIVMARIVMLLLSKLTVRQGGVTAPYAYTSQCCRPNLGAETMSLPVMVC